MKLTDILNELRVIEWNGCRMAGEPGNYTFYEACPRCFGIKRGQTGATVDFKPEAIGHKEPCPLAALILQLEEGWRNGMQIATPQP